MCCGLHCRVSTQFACCQGSRLSLGRPRNKTGTQRGGVFERSRGHHWGDSSSSSTVSYNNQQPRNSSNNGHVCPRRCNFFRRRHVCRVLIAGRADVPALRTRTNRHVYTKYYHKLLRSTWSVRHGDNVELYNRARSDAHAACFFGFRYSKISGVMVSRKTIFSSSRFLHPSRENRKKKQNITTTNVFSFVCTT